MKGLRTLRGGLAAVAVLFPALGFLLASTYPSWWASRGVIDTAAATNDFLLANQGQVKWIATKAFDELNAYLPGGAGTNLAAVISGFSATNNFCAVNHGQLKTLAKPFYDRLIAEGYTNAYPWTASTADDANYAAANIGQVKYLFSFDLRLDANGNGMPDWWETAHPGDPDANLPVAVSGVFGDYGIGSRQSERYILRALPLGATNLALASATWCNPNTNTATAYTNSIALNEARTLNLRWWSHTNDSRNVVCDQDYRWHVDGVTTNDLGWYWLARAAVDQTRTNGVVYSPFTNSTPFRGFVGTGHLEVHYADKPTQDMDFGGTLGTPATNGTPGKRVDVYVPLVDLDGDVDRNGVTNAVDAMVEGVAPGALLGVNNDDDNTNGVADGLETGTVAGENDLYRLRFTRGPESMPTGTVTLALAAGANRVRVWRSPTKGAGNLLLSSTTSSTNWVLTSAASWSTIATNLWIEGMTNGSTCADTILAARFSGPSGILCGDTNVFTVLRVDLDIDSDYDGDISDADDGIETSVGGAVAINSDDDDGNENVDRDETNSIAGENDLQRITLTLEPAMTTGTVKLETVYKGVGRIALWEGSKKTTSVSLTNTWDLSRDTVPSHLWIEGLSSSSNGARDVEIHLSYENGGFGCTDAVALTVCDIFHAIFDPDGMTYGILPWFPPESQHFTNYLVSVLGAVPAGGVFVLLQDSKGSFFVHVGSDEEALSRALRSEDAYVALAAHANSGLGPTFTTNCTAITSFFNMGTAYAGIDYDLTRAKYPAFSVADTEICNSASNYITSVSFERLPNVAWTNPPSGWPSLGYVAPSAPFPTNYFRTGYEKMLYYYGTPPTTNHTELIVSAGAGDLPPLRYRKFLMHSCSSGRHFADVFTNGVVFYATEDLSVPTYIVDAFMGAVATGKANSLIEADLDAAYGSDVYEYSSF